MSESACARCRHPEGTHYGKGCDDLTKKGHQCRCPGFVVSATRRSIVAPPEPPKEPFLLSRAARAMVAYYMLGRLQEEAEKRAAR